MPMNKILFTTSFCIAFITAANAQELGLTLKRGMSGLNYNVLNGDNKFSYGTGLGLHYTYFFNENWGLLSGLSYNSYSNRAEVNNQVVSSSKATDNTGTAFVYTSAVENYTERQIFQAYNIPLMLQYRTNVSENIDWYINGGGAVVLPSTLHYNASATRLSLIGYYPGLNKTVSNQPQQGFGTMLNWNNQNEAELLKTTFTLNLESGLCFQLSPEHRLYVGLYVDYGLNNLKTNPTSGNLFTYSSADISKIKSNGLMAINSATSAARLISIGVTAKITLGSKYQAPVE
jgi:hypothetical protein